MDSSGGIRTSEGGACLWGSPPPGGRWESGLRFSHLWARLPCTSTATCVKLHRRLISNIPSDASPLLTDLLG